MGRDDPNDTDMKKIFDLLLSLCLIMVLAVPIFIIAVLVKLTSNGPVLYWSDRVGMGNKIFKMPKFRTMRIDTPAVATHLLKDPDAYLTPIGPFLRKSSLDELPQLFNVLQGEMSLVGPRPAIPYELAAYQTWHRRRVLETKPGITGVWQVTGRSRVKFDEMVRMDLRYALAWSPWLDVKILLRTPFAVIRGSGAY